MNLPINEILCGDCLPILKSLPDKCIDLCLTDMPYGIGVAKTGTWGGSVLAQVKDYGKEEWDDKIPSKEVFDEIFRISKNQIFFGGNYFVEYLKNSSCWIVWDKDNGDNNFADCELAWTSFTSAVRKVKYRWAGMLQEDMKNKEIREHPTQKPVPLMRWILDKYSQSNDLILDPFAGSGTTCVAAKMENRRFIGIEISPKYCEIARQRVQSAPLPLFTKVA